MAQQFELVSFPGFDRHAGVEGDPGRLAYCVRRWIIGIVNREGL